MAKRFLTHYEVIEAAGILAGKIQYKFPSPTTMAGKPRVYGVPRGGVPVAYLLSFDCEIVSRPDQADAFVDDLIDSGATRQRYRDKYPKIPFWTLAHCLQDKKREDQWLVFPWEVAEGDKDTSGDDIVTRLLQYVGEDPDREGLKETPKRVLKAWRHWCGGYDQKPEDVLKCFADGGENYDEMVTVKKIPFFSTCEHHLAAFFGTATISYIPDKKVVGLSKLSRVLSIYTQRLQVQERITTQVADALQTHLKPRGVGVLLEARHLCMESRGISQQGSTTITTALRGKFMEDHKVRDEFLKAAQ
jgi:GTP cyclohydrolase I